MIVYLESVPDPTEKGASAAQVRLPSLPGLDRTCLGEHYMRPICIIQGHP